MLAAHTQGILGETWLWLPMAVSAAWCLGSCAGSAANQPRTSNLVTALLPPAVYQCRQQQLELKA